MSEENDRRKKSQQVHPETALGEEHAPQLQTRDGPDLPQTQRRTHRSPPIRYSYRAPMLSSAATPLSTVWPASEIRVRARENSRRLRVITSNPSRSSWIWICVMWSC